MEYILIASLILVIFIPAIYIFFDNMEGYNNKLAISKATRMGHEIVRTAEEVYYGGIPSKRTIKASMPQGIRNISSRSNWSLPYNELLFEYAKRGINESLVFVSDVNLNYTWNNNSMKQGTKTVLITANRTLINSSYVSYVQIKIK